jgi:DNA-binding NarL/FixJ family response regulator
MDQGAAKAATVPPRGHPSACRDRAEGEEMSDSRPKTRRWTPDEEGKLDELLDAGKEAAEIAVALSRTRQAVYARLQRVYRKRERLEAKGK